MNSPTFAIKSRPSQEQLLNLHLAYRRYRQYAASVNLPQDRPLILHHPEKRQTGYFVTVTEPQTPPAFAYYPGRTGLRSYLQAHRNSVHQITALSAVALPTEEIWDTELRDINRLQAGYRRNEPRPIFRSHMPYHPAWPPNETETTVLTDALTLLNQLGEHLRETPQGLDLPPPTEECPHPTPLWAGPTHQVEWHELPSLDQLQSRVGLASPEKIRQETGRATPSNEEWLVAYFHPPGAIFDQAGQHWRPHLKTGQIIVEKDTHRHLSSILCINRMHPGQMQSLLASHIEKSGNIPSRVTVEHGTAYENLEPLARELGFAIKMDPDMAIPVQPVVDLLEAME